MTRSSRISLSRFRGSLARLSPLIGLRPWTVAAIALGSAGAGLAEAGVLAVIAQIAASMSSGAEGQAFSLGPITLSAPTPVLLAVAGILAVVRLLLLVVVARLPVRLSGQVQTQLRERLFGSFLATAWPEKAKESEGHLQELMGEQTSLTGNAVLHLGTGLSAALTFLTLIASAFVLSVGVAAVVMATAVILFAGLRPLSRQVRRHAAATSSASVKQASAVAESVRLSEEIHVLGVADAERARVSGLTRGLEQSFVRTRMLSRVVPVAYQSAVILLVVAGLGLLYAISATHLAALGAVVLLLIRAASYGQQLQTAYQGLGETLPYLDRLTEAIESYRTRAARPGNRSLNSIRRIELESVQFSFGPRAPVLRDVSLSISAGEAVGVVGPTGAGKSTLLQLLLRLREPSIGSYRINGGRAGDIRDEVWHRKVAYLPQEPRLLVGTVAENIRFFRDWVDEVAIERAARLAHIHHEVMAWPRGYQTVIGPRADGLSGGQRQRLCLARGLAGSPELLLLDEPTSALDLASEQLIQETLADLRGAVTLVVVAHRPATVKVCDRLIVMAEGRIEAFATARLLYDSNDFFRRTIDLLHVRDPF
jgi:ATP-binding cassette subfamily B protein